MRALKILGVIVVVLVVLVGGALAFIQTQDFSKYQGVLRDEVKKATGRDLVIKGPLDVSIGLSPTVKVSDVTFQNASWGSRPELAKVKELDVQLQLIPLILGDIAINRIVLKGADILIETNRQGQNNYDFGSTGAAPSDKKPPATPNPASDNKAPASASPAKLPTIDKLSIADSTITIRNAQSGQNQSLKIAKLDATGVGSSGATKLDLDGVLNGSPLSLKASVESLPSFLASGNATIDVAVKAGGSSATLAGPMKNGTPAGIRISAQGDNLANLKPLIGAALPPLGPYSLQGIATGTGKDAYKLDIQMLKVGTTEIKGDIAVATEGGKPKLVANLSSPRINAKDFHKDSGAAKSGGDGGKGDGKVFPADPLPVDDLRLANATVNLRAGEIVNDEVRMQNLVLALTLVNGRLNVKPNATVSGGSVAIDMTLDASGATPNLAFALKGQKVSIGDLMKMLQNSDAISGGPADVDVNVRGAGNSVRAIMASLNGATSVSVAGGKLNNKNLAFVNADVMKLLGGAGNSTDIRCIVSRFNIVNGIATSQALQFDLTNIYGTGKGTINLGTEGLNMEIDPQTRQSAIASLAVPIDIKGTLANPSVTPDFAKRGTQVLKGVIDDKAKGGGGGLGGIAGTLLGGNKGGQQQAQGDGGGCGVVAEAQPAAPANQPTQPAQQPAQQPQQKKPTDPIKRLFR